MRCRRRSTKIQGVINFIYFFEISLEVFFALCLRHYKSRVFLHFFPFDRHQLRENAIKN